MELLRQLINDDPSLASSLLKAEKKYNENRPGQKNISFLEQVFSKSKTGNPSAEKLRRQGRKGDTVLAHINPREAALLQMLGGRGSRNPRTGLPEFYWGGGWGDGGEGDYGGYDDGDGGAGGDTGGGGEEDDSDTPDADLDGAAGFAGLGNEDGTPAGGEGAGAGAEGGYGEAGDDPFGGGLDDYGDGDGPVAGEPGPNNMPGTPFGQTAYDKQGNEQFLSGHSTFTQGLQAFGALPGGSMMAAMGSIPGGMTPYGGYEDDEDYGGEGDDGLPFVESAPPPQAPAFPYPDALDLPPGLALTGDPLQQRTQLATQALYGDPRYRAPEAIDYYKNLAQRYFTGPNNNLSGQSPLPIDLSFVTDVLGKARPETVEKFLQALA